MAVMLDPLKLERELAESEMEDEKIYFLEQFHPRGQKLDWDASPFPQTPFVKSYFDIYIFSASVVNHN